MDKEQAKQIAKDTIREKYPEMKDVEPVVERVKTDMEKSTFRKAGIPPSEGREIWVATFVKKELTEEGLELERIKKVTMDDSGRIIKLSESK